MQASSFRLQYVRIQLLSWPHRAQFLITVETTKGCLWYTPHSSELHCVTTTLWIPEIYRCAKPNTNSHKPKHLFASTPNITKHLFSLTAITGKVIYCLHERQSLPMQMSTSHEPPSWQSIPISTWMVFNYVPRGYHGSSISSLWQCNSLCPAAMSAKLRQFTCSCSYIALGKTDLPSIPCIHFISGTHGLTPLKWTVKIKRGRWLLSSNLAYGNQKSIPAFEQN